MSDTADRQPQGREREATPPTSRGGETMSNDEPICCPKCGSGMKTAPVQGYSAGIPWSMHLRAYDAYCKRYSPQKALIEGWCRGGFGTNELDMFIPGWREELLEINRLKAENAELRQQLKEAAIVSSPVSGAK